MARKIIIDTDPGQDDAVAILISLASPELEVMRITCVAGNTSLNNATLNALKICTFIDKKNIKIYAGNEKPLKRKLITADHVHGKSGLDYEGEEIQITNNYNVEK